MSGYLALLALVAMIGAFFVKMAIDKRRDTTQQDVPIPPPIAKTPPPPAPASKKPETVKPKPATATLKDKPAKATPKAEPIKATPKAKPAKITPKAEPAELAKKANPTKKKAPTKAKKTPSSAANIKVSVADSIKDDAIICLICGKSNKLLKAHLKRTHQMEPEQYRKQFKLPDSYPMTLPKKAKKA